MKKLQKLVLTFVVLFSIIFMGTSTTASAAKKVQLNKTKATITEGKTTTLKVKNTSKKVKWSTSDKKIATVSSKGVVKAKKAGNATITAKVNGKKYTCKVTVQTAQQELIAKYTKALNDGNYSALIKCYSPAYQKEIKETVGMYYELFDMMGVDFNLEGVINEVFASVIKTGANASFSSKVTKVEKVDATHCNVKVWLTTNYKYKGKNKSMKEKVWMPLVKVKGNWYIDYDSNLESFL